MKPAIFAALLSLGMASSAVAADIPKGCKKSKARPANPYGSVLVQQTEPAPSQEGSQGSTDGADQPDSGSANQPAQVFEPQVQDDETDG